MAKGKVFLVGAGPGDPGLLTVKGRACLEEAGAVIYDRLVNPGLLRYVSPEAEVIYAGKSPDHHRMSQAEINGLLVSKAMEGKTVVRLKGGDPFVFGRGGEEAEALAAHGIAFEIVPGVTAAVAVPAYAGIPVTHRRFNSSMAIVSGHEEPEKGESSVKWDQLATGPETLVFLMGRRNLASICDRLKEHGRHPSTPVAAIERGTTAGQRTVVGTLENIPQKACLEGIANPVVVVVGEVVSLRSRLAWQERKPLYGRRIVVTRARAQAGTLVRALEALGAEVIEFPTIEIVPPPDVQPLERAVDGADRYDWLVFTSVNGVLAFFERFFARGKDGRSLAGVRIGAIGEATAAALGKWGLRADLVPYDYRAEGLLAALQTEDISGKRVLLARAEEVRPVLAQGLREWGALVDEVVAYTTVQPRLKANYLRPLLERGRVDAVTFTSSSTVRNFAAMVGPETCPLLERVAVASIGPITSQTAREIGLRIAIQSGTATVAGLVEAIENYYSEVKNP